MKQALLKFLYKYVVSKVCSYTEHSLQAFEKASAPIITVLQSMDGIKIDKPFKVSDGGPEFHWVQTAMRRVSRVQHITISWRLQDDGGAPYPVIEMTKHVHFNNDSRDGIGQIGVTSIYPYQIVNIPKYFKILQSHPAQFTNHESFSSRHPIFNNSFARAPRAKPHSTTDAS